MKSINEVPPSRIEEIIKNRADIKVSHMQGYKEKIEGTVAVFQDDFTTQFHHTFDGICSFEQWVDYLNDNGFYISFEHNDNDDRLNECVLAVRESSSDNSEKLIDCNFNTNKIRAYFGSQKIVIDFEDNEQLESEFADLTNFLLVKKRSDERAVFNGDLKSENYNLPAFASTYTKGIAMLDYFASSYLSCSDCTSVKDAYNIAAQMIEERKKYDL